MPISSCSSSYRSSSSSSRSSSCSGTVSARFSWRSTSDNWLRRPASRWNCSSSKAGPVHTWTISADVLKSMNLDLDQARMGCTFVALVLAKTVYRNACQLPSAKELDKSSTLPLMNSMLLIMALGIEEGCWKHKEAVKQRRRDGGPTTNLFTAPDAIAEIGGIHEIDFLIIKNAYANLAKSLWTVIRSNLLASFSQIYIIMLIQKKAILVVYDRKEESITLIDGHSGHVAMIIASPIDHLDFFCSTVLIKRFPQLATDDRTEISVIQVVNDAAQAPVNGKVFHHNASLVTTCTLL